MPHLVKIRNEVRNAMRTVWSRSAIRDRVKSHYAVREGRLKFYYCTDCEDKLKDTANKECGKVYFDHRPPVCDGTFELLGSPLSTGTFIHNLLCIEHFYTPWDVIQPVCKPCHAIRTKDDKAEHTKNRRAAKS